MIKKAHAHTAHAMETRPGNQLLANQYAIKLSVATKKAASHAKRRVTCLLYTSDAADDLLCVDLGGRRTIKKKNKQTNK